MTIKLQLKSHKDLPHDQEIELVLWLGFLEDSINNALTQKYRWRRNKDGWDLKMFFVATVNIDDSIKNLKRFLVYDKETWRILKLFRLQIEKYKLRDIRNDIIHPGKLYKLQDKKGKLFLKTNVLNLGGYGYHNDEYIFGSNKIIISEVFQIVDRLLKDIKKDFDKKLTENPMTYEGMIPWTALHSFKRKKEIIKLPFKYKLPRYQ